LESSGYSERIHSGPVAGRRERRGSELEDSVVGDVETPLRSEPRSLALLHVTIRERHEVGDLTR
jgi:hypothetical protein